MGKALKKDEKNKKNVNFLKKVEKSESYEDFVIGRHAVMELLKGNRDVNKLFFQENLSREHKNDILLLAKQKGIQIQFVPKSKLDMLSDKGNHQGYIASIPPYDYASIEDLFRIAQERSEEPFFVILDGVEDPHNLGSIIRTADAAGVHGIIIPKRRSALVTATVFKTSTGAIEHVPVVRVTNLSQTIEKLKERGVWVFATDMFGKSYTKWQVDGALALVIGNEGKGVSRLVKDSADELITINMRGHVQSLNASVAASLLMYEVYRGRYLSGS